MRIADHRADSASQSAVRVSLFAPGDTFVRAEALVSRHLNGTAGSVAATVGGPTGTQAVENVTTLNDHGVLYLRRLGATIEAMSSDGEIAARVLGSSCDEVLEARIEFGYGGGGEIEADSFECDRIH